MEAAHHDFERILIFYFALTVSGLHRIVGREILCHYCILTELSIYSDKAIADLPFLSGNFAMGGFASSFISFIPLFQQILTRPLN